MTTENENGNGASPERATETNSDLESKIIRQIEFYFGDANLPKDKFMLEQVKLDDGWIPMSTMLKFQRLAKLTTDSDAIIKALTNSQLMEVDSSSDIPKIRRAPSNPLPELNAERRKEIQERTVYIKGFPLTTELDAILSFLEQFGPPANVHMRRYKDKLTLKFMFKGSTLVTFNTREKAEEFINIPSVKFEEIELIRMFHADYVDKKRKESEDRKKSHSKNVATAALKEKKENELKEKLKKGATIHLTGLPESGTREAIKEAFAKVGVEPNAYIGFNKGDKEAYLRLNAENSAAEYVEKCGGEITILDTKIPLRVLEGEEEETYLKKALEDKKAHMEKVQQSRRGGRKRRNPNRDDYQGKRNKCF